MVRRTLEDRGFMNKYFLSICIPSYNRPDELYRLLKSIDCRFNTDIQIVICEDKSPKRLEVRNKVEEYKTTSIYDVKYIENEINKGYDGNIRSVIEAADGEYIVLMGDDDLFISGKLDLLVSFLKGHSDIGYVLRSYRNNYINGDIEYYRYYDEHKFFEPGYNAYVELYRKSVFVSGFTFKRELVKNIQTDEFDGTLLYQLYIQAEICMNYPSAYFNEPLTEAYEGGDFYFGSSEAEKELYVPNKHTVKGEVHFISSFFKITKYMDAKYGIKSTEAILKDMSKYSFPMLALISENGRRDLTDYYRELEKMGFGCTRYFKFYYLAISFFGAKFCKNGIRMIKKILGKTPQL
jgi:glycosyltransferase involved in cell wall biosynthesis